ncbi:hypothetical protein L484_019976 [Morus notabilis]|uniref:Uncharacterized protein n=1 Tax=Morus notabilis TaxID=981085 RepID=W9QX38_9ROSA|nr:hypothetical protein L484_019976 [Morus notabilis]
MEATSPCFIALDVSEEIMVEFFVESINFLYCQIFPRQAQIVAPSVLDGGGGVAAIIINIRRIQRLFLIPCFLLPGVLKDRKDDDANVRPTLMGIE